MAAADICGQPVPDCRTIDATEEAALINAAEAFDPVSEHGTTDVAVDNLLSGFPVTPTRPVMIIGHGSPGLINTGSGLLQNDVNKKIEKLNRLKWRRELKDLKTRISELTFCSCDTGAEEEGAELLMMVRDVVKATVSGFTGQIFIDGDGNITCEEGGEWQHAQLGIELEPKPSPDHPIEGDMDSLKLKDHGKFVTFPISQVSQITYFEPQKPKRIQKGKQPQKGKEPEKLTWKPRFSLEGNEAQQLVRTVNFANPQEVKGAPLAVVTANLEVKINQRSRRFIVYNDRLLQDESATDTFYYASRDFIKRVREYLEPPHERTSPKDKPKPPQGERKPYERKPSYDKKR